MGARIGPGDEGIAVAKKVFDLVLVRRVFDVIEMVVIDDPGIRRVGEGRRCVGACDVVADFSEVIGAQHCSGWTGEQSDVLAEDVGLAIRVLGRVQLEVCVLRIGGELQVDEQ
ncbi:hypothetical protein [Nocardia rosealba]|uniref:hypothetical protein n=1 Tax=Nocardia rosealba TaxID=2878563 RepID=UPI001CD993C9|nr:hypothetical protein [Nocardia rosealba]MCA2210141.1 hypothetical protein [Nocardia rosealba]